MVSARILGILLLLLALPPAVRADAPESAFFVDFHGGVAAYALDDVDALIADADDLMVERSPLDEIRFGADGYRRTADGPIESGWLAGLVVGRVWDGGGHLGAGLESLGGASRTTASGANGSSAFVADVAAWHVFFVGGHRFPWSAAGVDVFGSVQLGVVSPRGSVDLRREGTTEEVPLDSTGISWALLLRLQRRASNLLSPFVEAGYRHAAFEQTLPGGGTLDALTGPAITVDHSGPLLRLGLRLGPRP